MASDYIVVVNSANGNEMLFFPKFNGLKENNFLNHECMLFNIDQTTMKAFRISDATNKVLTSQDHVTAHIT